MNRKLFACVCSVAVAWSAYGQGVALSIALPAEKFNRGLDSPVDGLIVQVTISNQNNISIELPKPDIHPEAAPSMAAKAIIKRIDEKGEKSAPVPPLPGLKRQYAREGIENLRIDAAGQATVTVDVGRHYSIRKPGRYEMTIVYRGMESNTVEFDVMPVRRVAVPSGVVLERIKDIEWGEPDYDEMFYVAPSARAWDEIVMVQRLGAKAEYRLTARVVGATLPGKLPDMIQPAPRVYVMVYPEKTGKGWVAAKIDCSRDPFRAQYKTYPGPEKPEPSQAAEEVK